MGGDTAGARRGWKPALVERGSTTWHSPGRSFQVRFALGGRQASKWCRALWRWPGAVTRAGPKPDRAPNATKTATEGAIGFSNQVLDRGNLETRPHFESTGASSTALATTLLQNTPSCSKESDLQCAVLEVKTVVESLNDIPGSIGTRNQIQKR